MFSTSYTRDNWRDTCSQSSMRTPPTRSIVTRKGPARHVRRRRVRRPCRPVPLRSMRINQPYTQKMGCTPSPPYCTVPSRHPTARKEQCWQRPILRPKFRLAPPLRRIRQLRIPHLLAHPPSQPPQPGCMPSNRHSGAPDSKSGREPGNAQRTRSHENH